MNKHVNVNDAVQQGLSFVISQVSHVEQRVWEHKYPEITYSRFIPVDNSANPWAHTVTFFSSDKVGAAAWMHGRGENIPNVSLNREKHETEVHMAGIGYEYGLEEISQAQMLGHNLDSDSAVAARRAYEEFCQTLAYSGDTNKGFDGLIDYTGITAVTAPNGAGGNSEWTTKTPDEILVDVNNQLSGVWTGSNTVEMADTILLPAAQYAYIASTRLTDTAMTILEFLMKSNVYTALTGQPLTIGVLKELDGAGAGSTDRMITYRRSDDVLKMHIPMPLTFFQVQQVLLKFQVPGAFRLGGLDIRRPGAVRYLDEI